MTASKKQMEVTIGPYENNQHRMLLEKSDLSVGLSRIAKETGFDESYYREFCVTQDPYLGWEKNSNIRRSLKYDSL